jgi:hypothetical protein
MESTTLMLPEEAKRSVISKQRRRVESVQANDVSEDEVPAL